MNLDDSRIDDAVYEINGIITSLSRLREILSDKEDSGESGNDKRVRLWQEMQSAVAKCSGDLQGGLPGDIFLDTLALFLKWHLQQVLKSYIVRVGRQ